MSGKVFFVIYIIYIIALFVAYRLIKKHIAKKQERKRYEAAANHYTDIFNSKGDNNV